MIEETGTVTKVDGIMATVAIQKKSSCDDCTAGACETTAEGAEIEALNSIHAEVGQVVRFSITPYTYLKGTMLVYGVPVVALIAGSIAGKNIGEIYFTKMNSDMIAAIAGFGLLVLSLLGIKILSKKLYSKTEYKPVIEEILDRTT